MKHLCARRIVGALPFRLALPLVLAWVLSGLLSAASPGVTAAADAEAGQGEREFGIAATWRGFHAEAGSSVSVSISTGTEESPCSATISLFTPDQRLFGREYDALYRILPYTGRYSVRIDGCTDGLRIRRYPPPRSDDYEVDDAPIMAGLLPTDGEPQLHSLHAPLDQDWVTFYLLDEQLLTLETYRLLGGCDTMLTLYDVNLNQLAANNDYAGYKRSFIQVLIPQAGQYFARVHHHAGQGAEGRAYLLRARAEPAVYGGKLRAARRLTFPTIPVGGQYERAVLVTNLGSKELLRFSVQSVAGPFATDLPAGETILLPRRSMRFKVRFSPIAKGPAAGRIVLTTTDPAHPTASIELTGRAR